MRKPGGNPPLVVGQYDSPENIDQYHYEEENEETFEGDGNNNELDGVWGEKGEERPEGDEGDEGDEGGKRRRV